MPVSRRLKVNFAAVISIAMAVLFIWRTMGAPTNRSKNEALHQQFQQAAQMFTAAQHQLLSDTRQLASNLASIQQANRGANAFQDQLQQFPQLWASAVYKNEQEMAWQGFAGHTFPIEKQLGAEGASIIIQKEQNVTYWVARVPLYESSPDSATYHLYTARRIMQTNALPFARANNFNILQALTGPKAIPLNISIFEDPPPADTPSYPLKNIDGEQVGVVYANAERYDAVITNWHQTNRLLVMAAVITFFVLAGGYLFKKAGSFSALRACLLRCGIIGLGWTAVWYFGIPARFTSLLFSAEALPLSHLLASFFVSACFSLAFGITLYHHFRDFRFTQSNHSDATIGVSGLCIAAANAVLLVAIFYWCFWIAGATDLPLLTLQIFPSGATIVLYLSFGLMLLALCAVTSISLQVGMRHSNGREHVFTLGYAPGFIITLFCFYAASTDAFLTRQMLILMLLFFVILFLVSLFLFRYPSAPARSSPLRNAAFASFFLALFSSGIIYNAQITQRDQELKNLLQSYYSEQNDEAEQWTSTILTNLEHEFRSLTQKQIQENTDRIRAQFLQQIDSTLNQNAIVFSVDVQLFSAANEALATYSTNLASPPWTNFFDQNQLLTSIRIERISSNNVQPVVQQPQLINASDYQTFARGWVPLFDKQSKAEEPIAWILCSVYKERANFNKPLQAVMGQQNNGAGNRSFVIQEYVNGNLQQTFYQGLEANYPTYNVLSSQEKQQLESQQEVFSTSEESPYTYRNLLVKISPERTLKISTLIAGLQNAFLLFFRISFVLLAALFITLLVIRFFQTGGIDLFGKSGEFKYRILDSLLLATLGFLIVLVLVSHYAIEKQNTNLVKEQLFEKLTTMADAIERQGVLGTTVAAGRTPSLDSLAAPLNVDASFYATTRLLRSTTPQLFQQHLIPSIMPYAVHDNLFNLQKRNSLSGFQLNNQQLLIGFRSILDANDQPVAAIALPTFVKSPKINQLLLQTTGYLLVLYLLVFSIFIIATTIIAHKLTRPLHALQKGLNRISKGDLDTKIPVTGTDEIAGLSMAFNLMVSRLKELQKELAAAEREAAWKEMARQVAHEIKNPLTPMKLNIQHLQRQMQSGQYTVAQLQAKVEAITDNLISQIQRLSKIASDFSKFAKPVTKEFKPVDMQPLVQSVAALFHQTEKIPIITECTASDTRVMGDDDELQRVMVNLVKNAVEAIPESGQITLKMYASDAELTIEVADSGIGIRPEDEDHLFVPNFSTKSSGTGLGLAISKKIVEAHEGTISFTSVPGSGTTFTVILPLAAEQK